MSMKLVVAKLPKSRKTDYFQSRLKVSLVDGKEVAYDEVYHPHIDEYGAIKHTLGKPTNELCNCKNCNLLEVIK